ncbi:hypothetical protein D3C76_1176010 [compost metagenome]
MPRFTGLGLDHDVLTIVAEHAAATAGHVQHQRINIAGQQQVAAATDHQHRHPLLLRLTQRQAHLLIIVRLAEKTRLHVDAEGVVRFERYLLLPRPCHSRPLISNTSAWHAASTRSSTCSKPSAPP